jgi:hypothetical protein
MREFAKPGRPGPPLTVSPPPRNSRPPPAPWDT